MSFAALWVWVFFLLRLTALNFFWSLLCQFVCLKFNKVFYWLEFWMKGFNGFMMESSLLERFIGGTDIAVLIYCF